MKHFVLSTVLFSTAVTLIAQPQLLNASLHPKFQNPVPKLNQIRLSSSSTNVFEAAETKQWLGLIHPQTQKRLKTTIWGYGLEGSPTYPGPTLLAKSDVSVRVEWRNNLPQTHLLPVDTTYHAANPKNGVPMVTHLHGGHTDAASDGGPEAWYTADYAETGSEFKQKVYKYSNDQEGANLWYHDHTLGLTRLNVYAGLVGFYKLTDANDKALRLPSGDYDRELLIQDKMFYENGEKYYPAEPDSGTTAANPSGLPEFFGDFILVNGMIWPYMKVEPRPYRLRLVNASDARVYQLVLSNGGSFLQIASDLGKLNKPASKTKLDLAPGERVEIIIDFSKYRGQTFQLLNQGTDGPFGNPESPAAHPLTTGQIMQFRVVLPLNCDVEAAQINEKTCLRPVLGDIQPLGKAQVTRKLALFEGTDGFGRVLPSLGIIDSTHHHNGSLSWSDHVTENIHLNDTEIWEIYNSTEDAHPIHLHLVAFQVMSRQNFVGTTQPKVMTSPHGHGNRVGATLHNIQLTGKKTVFKPSDNGWKDTYVIQPGEMVRLKAKFDKAGSYVWHCHILSHEDHDMMRPLVISAKSGSHRKSEVVENESFMIYPNPAQTILSVDLKDYEGQAAQLYLYNALGGIEQVHQIDNVLTEPFTLNVAKLASGAYLLRVESEGKPTLSQLVQVAH
jgi:spore coat protein A, manganese oxidase